MKSSKKINRKSTFTFENHPNSSVARNSKTPTNRISSLKNISIQEVPFYRHIFPDKSTETVDSNTLIVAESKRLTLDKKKEVK
jgi:hypothetical protein